MEGEGQEGERQGKGGDGRPARVEERGWGRGSELMGEGKGIVNP